MQEEIIKKINQEQKRLKEELETSNPEIKHLETFLEKTDFSNPMKFQEIDIKEFIINSVPCLNPNYTRKELEQITSYLVPVLNKMSCFDIYDFTETPYLVDEKLYSELEKATRELERDHLNLLTSLNRMSQETDDFNILVQELTEFCDIWENVYNDVTPLLESLNSKTSAKHKKHTFMEILDRLEQTTQAWGSRLLKMEKFHVEPLNKMQDFILEYKEDPETWDTTLSRVAIIRDFIVSPMIIKPKNLLMVEYTQNNSGLLKWEDIDEEERIEAAMEEFQETKEKMTTHLRNLKREERKKRTETAKDIKKYDKLKRTLAQETDEITNYRLLIEFVKNQELRTDILKYIYEYNSKKYDDLIEKYQALTENSVLGYQSLCQQYNLVNINIENLMKDYSYQELKDTLSSITKITTNEKIISSILKVTNKKTAKEIENLINNNVLSLDVAQNTTEIWDRKKDYPTTIKENKKVIEDITSSDDLYKKRNQVLLIPTDKLQTNLKKLDEYLLLPSLSTTTNYQFLGYDNLEEIMDLALELGKEQDIVDNIGLLNYDINRWYRLNILNQLNIPVEKDQLEGVLHTDNFLVPDNKISEYLDYNFVINQDIEIPEDEVTETKRTYLYQGIHFSKMKAERNLKETLSNNQQPIITELLIKDRMFSENEKSILKENASYSK